MVVKINGSAAANVGRALLQAGSATASDLADELGLTGAGIRKHLDALLEEGLVEFSERAPYGPAALAGPKVADDLQKFSCSHQKVAVYLANVKKVWR